jgi:hypothetical protein
LRVPCLQEGPWWMLHAPLARAYCVGKTYIQNQTSTWQLGAKGSVTIWQCIPWHASHPTSDGCTQVFTVFTSSTIPRYPKHPHGCEKVPALREPMKSQDGVIDRGEPGPNAPPVNVGGHGHGAAVGQIL